MNTLTLSQRIQRSIARNPQASAGVIAKNLKCLVAEVRAVMDACETFAAPLKTAGSLEGLPLDNRNVLSRRPAESASRYIKQLPNNRGFCSKELSKVWGLSDETIKRHARDLGCLKYVEVEEDEWKLMVMSPETAKRYR